jgi:hypothetical protein
MFHFRGTNEAELSQYQRKRTRCRLDAGAHDEDTHDEKDGKDAQRWLKMAQMSKILTRPREDRGGKCSQTQPTAVKPSVSLHAVLDRFVEP